MTPADIDAVLPRVDELGVIRNLQSDDVLVVTVKQPTTMDYFDSIKGLLAELALPCKFMVVTDDIEVGIKPQTPPESRETPEMEKVPQVGADMAWIDRKRRRRLHSANTLGTAEAPDAGKYWREGEWRTGDRNPRGLIAGGFTEWTIAQAWSKEHA